jgi:hypothetical protein
MNARYSVATVAIIYKPRLRSYTEDQFYEILKVGSFVEVVEQKWFSMASMKYGVED